MNFIYIWKYNLLSALSYRVSFLMQTGFMIINNIFFIYIWYLFFQRFHTIGWLTFEEYIPLFAFFGMLFAFVYIFAGGFQYINQRIRNGEIDSELLLPGSLLLRLCTSSISISAIGDAIFSIVVLFVLTPNIITPFFLFKFFFMGILGGITFLGIAIVYHSLAFYIRSSSRIAENASDAIFGPSFYPQSIFEWSAMKIIYLTVFPAFFITYYPYNFLMNSMDVSSLLLTIFGVVFFFSFGSFVFYHGLRRYESGNIVQVRV